MSAIEDQKIQDWLLSASEISHSYSQKLLVMTDTAKSTKDRVQQEYSMDPHSSVIVSTECLNEASCVPQADSYTVVKIFGSVSADGRTVSGLSASSLAELLLKPPLEVAPVFSLNGNTTTDFQNNFMRVFMIRGIKAVLEMSQGDHQIYKVMNHPDAVSGYKSPQRSVDHTTQYDRQHILIMETDPTVITAATYLYDKHPAVSSVYVLDENQRPKLIRGDSAPLTQDSRLVLVGHGRKEKSGEVRLAGYTAEEVTDIIKKVDRTGDKIRTTSVVACEVGSDKVFVETLLRQLQAANIETELHVRNTVLQVRHTGEKITQEISTDGLQWRHKDESQKVVAALDRNGNVVIRNEPGSKGEPVFTNERNVLLNEYVASRFKVYREAGSWPPQPRRFIDQNIFEKFDPTACHELEALSWGIFHKHLPGPSTVDTNNLKLIKDQYIIRKYSKNEKQVEWITDVQGIKDVLSTCYEVKSGADVRKVIRHYAKTGEDKITYLMVNEWIYAVDPKTLYVYLYGKKLDSNQRENMQTRKAIKECINEQIDNEQYGDMKDNIYSSDLTKEMFVQHINHMDNEQYQAMKNRLFESDMTKEMFVQHIKHMDNEQYNELWRNNPLKQKIMKEMFVQNMRDTFLGERTTRLPPSTEAWFTTYFTASVISESSRNFRTFPLVLMGLDMVDSKDINLQEKGLEFFFEEHPMARGRSWIDPSRRGFTGSATPEGSSKLNNKVSPPTRAQLQNHLEMVVGKEVQQYRAWIQDQNNGAQQILTTAEKYKITQSDPEQKSILHDYMTFKEKVNEAPPSGRLGGYNDGHTTPQDLISATKLENSFKLESHYSRLKTLFADQISSQLKSKHGENLAGMHLQEGSARIEDGQFICHLVSDGVDAEAVEFRAKLSPDSQSHYEKMLKDIDAAARDLESHGSVGSHEVNKYVEHTGTAVGTLGLMLGMKGAVRAFEQGDIKHGVIGTLQTAHGVTAMTSSVIAKQALSAETRITRAASAIMKSPAMKGALKVIPLVGIGFGVYNIIEDLNRSDALGYIDATLDLKIVELDVLEIVQPELAPFIAPITVALSVVRMVIDDIYMSIKNELQSLPKDAGVLDKVLAGLRGFGKGILHFVIHVASFFYDWGYEEIEEGHRLVAQISDYHKYYRVIKQQDGTNAIDLSGGDSSWNGGAIHFCLADRGQSELCMDYFVSRDESPRSRCWGIDTQGSQDIILGLGESHQLEHKNFQKKILMFIPAGSVKVVSGYDTVSKSRYGIYRGNKDSNRFFAIQKAENKNVSEVMLAYYYELYGEPGDDTFFLGPQRSYVQGSGGQDTYIIPEHGGKTIINNYDPSKATDTIHFSVNYSHISVSKSGNNVVLMYENKHTVIIEEWFSGELYRHMNLLSGDGVLFEISSTVVSSVRLVARGINKMFKTRGEDVDASQPLLRTVTNIFGSQYNDVLIGNGEKNLIDGGGGHDRLMGGEEEDIYMVKGRKQSAVWINNESRDSKTDLAIIEANLLTFTVRVEGENIVLNAFHDNTAIQVTLERWFNSPAHRHLLVITKDLVTFRISDNKADCLQSDPFSRCIKSLRIDYSSSPSALHLDLQANEALDGVTEVRGSNFNDVIKGNNEHNVIIPGNGNDFMEGRRGEDWYVITPGQGVKTINNYSPDLVLDTLFLKEDFKHMTCVCEGQSIMILLFGRRDVILENWFKSKSYQHLQIKSRDGITAELAPSISSCGRSLIVPLTVDYRNQEPKPLEPQVQKLSKTFNKLSVSSAGGRCVTYRSRDAKEKAICGSHGKVLMNNGESVKEMYGSAGFDIMVGNSNENLLDSFTGGALMSGGEGKDTYVIKRGYGLDITIDNFAEDLKTDTVLVDMDFLGGGRVKLDSSAGDLTMTIQTKGQRFGLTLLDYWTAKQNQHIEFLSSDGVQFKLKTLNSTGDGPFCDVEAFKVTLKQTQIDCHLDLNSQTNLSKVHTVQGCPFQSNNILGNTQDNALIGGLKDDIMQGGEGDDTLMGGNGDDLLVGDVGDDTLYGEDGNDTMMGNSGEDVFFPGPGADVVDGGPGRDSVLYRGDHDTGKGVYVNLLTGQGRYADAEGDTLKDVETVIGTIYSDTLVSGYESSLLKGSDGNDLLVSTGGDYLVGGDGHDIYMLAFHHGSVTIDNCAQDNATDFLYWSSQSPPIFDCESLLDRVLLTFFGFNQTVLRITLQGWTSDDAGCGHLKLVFRGAAVSVDRLLKQCSHRQKEAAWSAAISWVICIVVLFFHCVLIFQTYRKSKLSKKEPKTQKQPETNPDAESASMMADAE